MKPKIMVLDEAAFVKEPETLLPIISCLPSVERVFLIGDHAQLPPVVKSLREKKWVDGNELFVNPQATQMKVPLFTRLVEAKYPGASVMTKQFRMAANISELASELFYKRRLENDSSTKLESRPLARKFVKFLKAPLNPPDDQTEVLGGLGLPAHTNSPLALVDVSDGATEILASMSKRNLPNIPVGIQILIKLFTFMPTLPAANIRYITPHKAQNVEYRRALAKAQERCLNVL